MQMIFIRQFLIAQNLSDLLMIGLRSCVIEVNLGVRLLACLWTDVA